LVKTQFVMFSSRFSRSNYSVQFRSKLNFYSPQYRQGVTSVKRGFFWNKDKGSQENQEEFDSKDRTIRELETKVTELDLYWMNLISESENVKKRMEKEVQRAQGTTIDKMVKSLFPIIDNLNICLQNRPDFTIPPHNDNTDAKVAFESLETTKKQFQTMLLDSYDISEFSPKIGENFDPMKHNAVFEVDSPNIEPGKIGVVVKNGWKRNDHLIRPATIGTVRH